MDVKLLKKKKKQQKNPKHQNLYVGRECCTTVCSR